MPSSWTERSSTVAERENGPRPLVSVVIPTYGRRALVRRALAALERQTLAPDAFEVIVAIDGSDDGTREEVEALSPPYRLRALWLAKAGQAAARNAALRVVEGELVVILDDDMEPTPRCLEAHAALHPPGSRRCVIGAAPMPADPAAPPIARYVAGKFDEHLRRLAAVGGIRIVRDFYTGNVSIRRDVLVELGGFDESFREYGNEDLELAVRLLRAGVSIEFSAEAAAAQNYAKDFAALARDTVSKGRTAVLLATLHPEVIEQLRLATYASGPRAWRLARGLLLSLPRLATAHRVVALTSFLERRGVRRLSLYYALVLDYLYWLGARAAVREGCASGAVASVLPGRARGPIGLLLHR